MKNLFIAMILLIIASLIAPKFIGDTVQAEYKLRIDKLNESHAISVNSSTFSRNWFNGMSTVELTVVLDNDEIDNITVIIEESLSFGPVIFTDEGVKFGLSHSQANVNIKGLDSEVSNFIHNKIHLSTLLTYTKGLVSTIIVDEFTTEVDGNTLTSAKAVGLFTFENENRLYGDFTWPGLKTTTRDANVVVSNVTLSLDQTLIAGDYYQGNAITTGGFDFTIAAIKVNDLAGNKALALEGLLFSALSTVANDLMEIKMNYRADKIIAAGQSLEKANLSIVFNDLNIKVMQELNELMTELSADALDMFNAENMDKISVLSAKLLADQPTIKVTDLSVQTPEGKIESSMEVTVDKNTYDPSNITSIMQALKVKANGKVPTPFVVKLGLMPMVQMYIDQGLVIQQDQEVSFILDFSQGQLSVNNKVIPL